MAGHPLRRPAFSSELAFYKLGPPMGPESPKGDKSMNDLNRVLARKGARDLNEQEVEHVGGGIRTATLCTAPTSKNGSLDGDTFMSECGADV